MSTGVQGDGRRTEAGRSRGPLPDTLPSPFPEGWYFIATRQAVEKVKLAQKTWMGEKVLIWCDRDGKICVSETHCPHLGADMAPAAGGCIRDGRLICPFHGYEFDTTGQCVATPFAPPPKTARLRVYETQEVGGLVFAWWGLGERAPHWSLPTVPPEQEGWSRLSRSTPFAFPAIPQDTTENVG